MDQRRILNEFKEKVLQPLMAPLSVRQFQLFRNLYDDRMTEVRNLAGWLGRGGGMGERGVETSSLTGLLLPPPPSPARSIGTLRDNMLDGGSMLELRAGKALGVGEVSVGLQLLRLGHEQPFVEFISSVASEKMTVEEFKHSIIAAADDERRENPSWAFKDLQLTPSKMRIRDVGYPLSPRSMLLNDQPMGALHRGKRFCLQVLGEGVEEEKTDKSQILLMVRVWHPDTFVLDKPFEVVTAPDPRIGPVREQIAAACGIEAENMAFAVHREAFPYFVPRTDIERQLNWQEVDDERTKITTITRFELYNDGVCFFVKDKTKTVKTLSDEEAKAVELVREGGGGRGGGCGSCR